MNPDPAHARARACYHEAGHAVVTLALGVPIAEIRIDGDSGFSEKAETFDKLILRLNSATEVHRIFGLIHLAGGYAQKQWQSDVDFYGCRDDLTAAAGTAKRLRELDGGTDWLEKLNAESQQLVANNWQKIEALAQALLQRMKKAERGGQIVWHVSIDGKEANDIVNAT